MNYIEWAEEYDLNALRVKSVIDRKTQEYVVGTGVSPAGMYETEVDVLVTDGGEDVVVAENGETIVQ